MPALAEGGLALPFRQQGWLIVWWVVAIAVAFGSVPRSTPPRGWRVAAGGLVALAALQLASAIWGPSADRALADACRTVGYLGILALAWTFLGPRSWRASAGGVFVTATAVTAYALLGRLVPELPGAGTEIGSGRLAEPLGYWNALGAWAAMTAAMTLAWSADARGVIVRQASAAMLPVAAVVAYLTYSRGAVLATALGVLVVVALSRNPVRAGLHAAAGAAGAAFSIVAIESQAEIANGTGTEGAAVVGVCVLLSAAGCWVVANTTRHVRREQGASGGRRSRWALAGAGAAGAALAIVAIVAGSDGFGRGGDGAVFADDPSARLTTAGGNRSALWSEAGDGFAAQPIRGEGAGSFGYRWAREGSDAEQVADPHSLPFAIGAELGVLGLLALGAVVIGVAGTALRGLAAAARNASAVGLAGALGAFALSLLVDWTWDSTALATLAVASAGVLGMAAATPGGRGAPAWRWSGFAAALAFGAIQVPGAVSAQLALDSQEQRRLGDPEAAVARADEALDAAPWSATAIAARAEAELDLGLLDEALRDAGEAIEREPLEAQHLILLARVEMERDDLEAAAGALADAVRLSPHEPRLGGAEVLEIGERLERAGFDESDIIDPPEPQ